MVAKASRARIACHCCVCRLLGQKRALRWASAGRRLGRAKYSVRMDRMDYTNLHNLILLCVSMRIYAFVLGVNECAKSTVHHISTRKFLWQAGLAGFHPHFRYFSSFHCLRMFAQLCACSSLLYPFMVNTWWCTSPAPGWWFGLDYSKGTDEGRCDWSRNQCWRHWTDALAILGMVPNMIFVHCCSMKRWNQLICIGHHWVIYALLAAWAEDWHGMGWGSLCCSTQPSSVVCSSRSLQFVWPESGDWPLEPGHALLVVSNLLGISWDLILGWAQPSRLDICGPRVPRAIFYHFFLHLTIADFRWANTRAEFLVVWSPNCDRKSLSLSIQNADGLFSTAVTKVTWVKWESPWMMSQTWLLVEIGFWTMRHGLSANSPVWGSCPWHAAVLNEAQWSLHLCTRAMSTSPTWAHVLSVPRVCPCSKSLELMWHIPNIFSIYHQSTIGDSGYPPCQC